MLNPLLHRSGFERLDGVGNIVSKGEIAQDEQFHHFPKSCFLSGKIIELLSLEFAV